MKPFLRLILTYSLLALNFGTNAHAQITTDGTTPTTCNGGGCSGSTGNVNIAGGVIAGSNQFHSFSDFSITSGDSATFTGPMGIENVISRVTGGNPSSIFGSLISNVTGADFYFINPNGIIFGDSSIVDVSAGFHLGAVQNLISEDGDEFSTNTGSTFFSSSPESFGFSQAAGELMFEAGTNTFFGNNAFFGSLTLAGNGVTVGDATNNEITLYASDGVNIVSGNQGEFQLQTGNTTSDFVASDLSISNTFISTIAEFSSLASGNIKLIGSEVNFSGLIMDASTNLGDAGDISVRASHLNTVNGALFASALNGEQVGEISIDIENDAVFNNFDIVSGIANGSFGAPININVGGALSLLGASEIFSVTQFQSGSGGAGGDINLSAGSLAIMEQSIISSTSLAGGSDAGNINLNISGNIDIVAGVDSNQRGPNVIEGSLSLLQPLITASTASEGDAGDINISAQNLSVFGGLISASSVPNFLGFPSGGNPGSININVSDVIDLEYDGTIPGVSSGIGVQQLVESSDGTNSMIDISAGSLNLSGLSTITTSVASNGNGADIRIAADESINLDGEAVSISSRSSLNGNPALPASTIVEGFSSGEIILDAGTINISSAIISTGTNTPHDAGAVTINTDSLSITNGDIASTSGDVSQVAPGILVSPENLGNSGSIIISINGTGTLDNGSVSTATFADGSAGSISIEALDLNLNPGAEISSAVLGSGDPNVVSEINIDVSGTLSIVSDFTSDMQFDEQLARISSRTNGEQQGGTININTGFLLIEGSAIESNTAGGTGNAGDINISSNGITVRGFDGDGENIESRSLVIHDDRPSGNAGNINIVSNGDLIIENFAEIQTSSDSPFADGGFAGDIAMTVSDGNLILRDSGEINSTGFVVPGGSITITAPNVLLNDGSSIEIGSIPQGGDVVINLGEDGTLFLRNNSFISANGGSTFQPGAEEFFDIMDGTGGTIKLQSTESGRNFFVVLNESSIQSTGDNPAARLELDSGAFLFQDNLSTIAIDGANISPDPQVGGDNEDLDENFENADQILASQCASQRGGQSSGLSILPNMGVATASDLKPSPLGGTVFYGGEALDDSANKEAHNKIDPFQDCI